MNYKIKVPVYLLLMTVLCAMNVYGMDDKNSTTIRGKIIFKKYGLHCFDTFYKDEKKKLEKIFGEVIPGDDPLIAVTIESDDLEKVLNTYPGFAQAQQYLKQFGKTGNAQKIADCEKVLVQGATRLFPTYWPTSLLKDTNKGDEVVATIYGLPAIFKWSAAKTK